MERSRVALFTSRSGYPDGFGAASILRKYGAGLTRLGYHCDILLLRPSEVPGSSARNSRVRGSDAGVSFEYLSSTVRTSPHPPVRIALYCYALLRALAYLWRHRRGLRRVFFYSPDGLISSLTIQIACRLLGISCVAIKTESSFSDSQRTRRRYWRTAEAALYPFFDSIITVTTHLEEQLRTFGYSGPIKVLPIVVDEQMYRGVQLSPKQQTLLYMGTLGYEAELSILVRSFAVAARRHPAWRLLVAGSFTSSAIEASTRRLIQECDLEDRVSFLGHVGSDALPGLLGGVGVMLLPRPRAEYSNAGFPIKLGEYLLSGAPVVATATGEIPSYLTDGEDAFLCEPGEVEQFGLKIDQVLSDYDAALEVGRHGRELALRVFGAEQVCAAMMNG